MDEEEIFESQRFIWNWEEPRFVNGFVCYDEWDALQAVKESRPSQRIN
jgi:hypothetical protein